MRSTIDIARHGLVTAALALAVTGLVAGCSVGQVTQTDQTVATVPGANADLAIDGGTISVRNVLVPYPGPQGYPRGGTAPLEVRIFNDSTKPVMLTGARSELGTVQLFQGGPAAAPAPAPAAPPTPAPTPTASAAATPSAGPTPSPAPAAPNPSPTAATPAGTALLVAIPAGGYVTLSRDSGQWLGLVGLTEELVAGDNVPLELTFTSGAAADLALEVPVDVPDAPLPRSPMVFEEHGAEGSHG